MATINNTEGGKMSKQAIVGTIKIMKHFVQNIANGQKAKVWYSRGQVCRGPSGEVGLFDCITIYAKEYGYGLDRVMEGMGKTENDTDSMTDYFDKSHFRVFPDSPMFSRVSEFAK